MAQATTIREKESLRAWLNELDDSRRRQIAVVLSVRSALRVLPLLENLWAQSSKLVDYEIANFLKVAFWRCLIAKSARRWPDEALRFADLATGSSYHSVPTAHAEAERAADAIAFAATCATTIQGDYVDAAVASMNFAISGLENDDRVEGFKNVNWNDIFRDASYLAQNEMSFTLYSKALWISWPVPLDWSFILTTFGHALKSERFALHGWSIWLEWFEFAAQGLPAFGLRDARVAEKLERAIALGGKGDTFHNEFWLREPGEINREIAEWVAEARAAERVVENKPTELTGEARLAGYRFVDDGQTIKGHYHVGAAFEAETARQLLHELLQKLKKTAERLTRAQVDPALPKVIQAIADYLDKQSASMNAGLVLSQFRTWETNLASVSSALRGQPLDNDLPGILASTQQTFEDLMAMFPSIATIEANRLTLRLQSADAQTVDQSIVAISVLAETNIAVDQSARDALKDLQVEVSKLNEIIASSNDHDAVAVAIETRGVIVGQRAMTTAGFVHTVLKAAGNRIAKGAGDGLEKGVAEVTEAGVKLALIGLVGKLGGPLASVAALLAMFKPYAKKAEEIKKETTKDDDVTDV